VAGVASFSVYKSYYQCGYYSCGYTGFWQTYSDGFANVLLGYASGGFAAPEVYPLGRGNSPAAIAIGDLDGDGNDDVITANTYNLSALLGDGTGNLEAAVNSGSGYPLKSISLGDLDGDGHLDTITNFSNSLTVQKGQGDGTFVPSNTVNMGLPVSSAVVGDVNGDGKLDLWPPSSIQLHQSGYYGCYRRLGEGMSAWSWATAGRLPLPIASSLGTDFNAAFVWPWPSPATACLNW
jgi:hypothetical protein